MSKTQTGDRCPLARTSWRLVVFEDCDPAWTRFSAFFFVLDSVITREQLWIRKFKKDGVMMSDQSKVRKGCRA